ncbi:MAG TPA: GTP-binding protein [Candidatus Deferrimicrobium sp.]|nr:GTP-binding protein [Candidatus Deferrimicrobium sp.]
MKILITGEYHAGKSTFVRTACSRSERPAVNIDRGKDDKTTVAMDFGIVELKGLRLSLFGTPGLARFDIIRRIVSKGADAVIFLIDAADELMDYRVKYLYEEIETYLSPLKIPYIFACNKMDLPNTRTPEKLKKFFKFIGDGPLYPISAMDYDDVERVLLKVVVKLVDKVLPILKTLHKHHGEVQGVEIVAKELGKSTYETRAYLRWLERRRLIDVDWRQLVYYLCPGLLKMLEK